MIFNIRWGRVVCCNFCSRFMWHVMHKAVCYADMIWSTHITGLLRERNREGRPIDLMRVWKMQRRAHKRRSLQIGPWGPGPRNYPSEISRRNNHAMQHTAFYHPYRLQSPFSHARGRFFATTAAARGDLGFRGLSLIRPRTVYIKFQFSVFIIRLLLLRHLNLS